MGSEMCIRDRLTRMRFLPDPATGDVRVYRTGDLGVLRADGCLEFLGRTDEQVKIRGNRVELAEIEMALLGVDAVKEAAAVARSGSRGRVDLIGYVVPVGPATPAVAVLRRALAATLRGHMIPSTFVMLERLPRIGNGKVDRRALAELDRLPVPAGPSARVRSPIEEAVGRIWCEVLDREEIGIHDEFLDIGGNSLRAASIVSRVLEAVGVGLPARELLAASPIGEMAAVITSALVERMDRRLLDRVLDRLQERVRGSEAEK